MADGGHRRLDGGRGRRRRQREQEVAAFESARSPVGTDRQQPRAERIRRVDLLAVPDGERPRSHVDPPRVGARRRRSRRSRSVLRPSPRAGARLVPAARWPVRSPRSAPGTWHLLRSTTRARRIRTHRSPRIIGSAPATRWRVGRRCRSTICRPVRSRSSRIDRRARRCGSRSTVRREARVRPRGSLIFLRSGFLRLVPVTLDAEGDADITVPFSSGQVSRVVLVVANASTDFRCWTGAGYSCNGRSRADGMPFRYLATLVHRAFDAQSSSALVGNGSAIGS